MIETKLQNIICALPMALVLIAGLKASARADAFSDWNSIGAGSTEVQM